MKNGIYFFMDLSEYAVKGAILAWFLHGMVKERYARRIGEKCRYSVADAVMTVQFVIVQMLFYGIPAVQRLLYGENMLPQSSKTTAIVIGVSMLCSFLVSLLVYQGDKWKLFYYITVFYTMHELVRFMIYSVFTTLLELVLGLCLKLMERGILIDAPMFEMVAVTVEVLWNLLFLVTLICILWGCIRRYKKYLCGNTDGLNRTDILFLTVPNFIGLLLCVLIRTIFYSIQGNEVRLIFTEYAELNVIVPFMAFLALASILLSGSVFCKLREENEEKLQLQLYKEHMHGMEAQIKDMEQFYDGLRAVKHDMRHHMADMETLLLQESGVAETAAQLKEYVTDLERTIDAFDMKYRTGNPVTDVIMERYVRITQEKQIAFESDFIFPKDFHISAFDLSIILNNALENAVEACEKLPMTEKRNISLTSFCRGNMFFIELQNSCDGNLTYEGKDGQQPILKTTKTDTKLHGLGFKNMERCAEKYYGKAAYTMHDGTFKLCVMLQKKEASKNANCRV